MTGRIRIVDCPRCHGEGVVVPETEWEPALCLLCWGKGWIGVPVGKRKRYKVAKGR